MRAAMPLPEPGGLDEDYRHDWIDFAEEGRNPNPVDSARTVSL
jgi:hypothetical protein